MASHARLQPASKESYRGSRFEGRRRLGVADGFVGPPRERAHAGRQVHAGEGGEVGLDGRWQELLGPADGLEALEHHGDERGVGRDRRRRRQVVVVGGPSEGGPQVGELPVHPIEGDALLGAVPPLPRGGGLGGEVRRVQVPHLVGDALPVELVLAEVTDRLEQAVPGLPRDRLRGDQGLAHQRVEQVEHGEPIHPRVRTDVHRGGHPEPAGEHRAPVEQVPLVGREQVVGPRHRREQGLVVLRAPSGAGEESEAIVEVVAHLLGAHRHHAGGGQLDGEGDPIEALADLGHRRGLGGCVEREPGLHGLRSLEEQLDRGRVEPGSCVEGRNGPPVLRREAQALAAGGQDPDGGGPAQDRVDEVRGRGQDVLAVVDHDEQTAARQRPHDALGHRPASVRP